MLDTARFGKMSENLYALTDKRYSAPAYTLRGEHPRVCLHAAMIPAIRAALDNPDCRVAAEQFREYVECPYTGILGTPEENHDGRKGLHNFDKKGLAIIEAKALHYLLSGDSRYGYEALYALYNYIDTLDIQWIASDHCREYGYLMFIAAEVYDWCYDLMTPEMRLCLIAGIENRACAGTVGYPDFTSSATYKLKMEVGFPPTAQGGVNGHGSENQILRDYLAFAIAIYDENPSWWEFVCGRLQDDYIPVRREFYKADFYPQGTSTYLRCRFYADLYSAWLFLQATGENPYEGLERVMPSLFAMETPNEISFFGCGDGTPRPPKETYSRLAIINAAITKDPKAWALVADAHGFDTTWTGHVAVTAASMLIFASGGTESISDWRDTAPLQLYNGSWLGQITTRARWHDENAPALQLKVGVKSTGNHDHGDSGSFQIYYKGLLTHDGGVYSNYGHYQTRFFHCSSISHNTLLISDPSLAKPDSEVPAEKWYCGSQRIRMSVADWINSDLCVTGKVTGMQTLTVKVNEQDEARYAYIAGDITKAYDEAEYASRAMLAVYTDDKEFPMVLFVKDDITSVGADFKKTFLFHIASPNEPVIAGNTIVTENETGGQLRLISLSDNVITEAIGGEGKRQYINGNECLTAAGTFDKHWGRIEISLPTGEKDGDFLNVLYVTDAGKTLADPAPKVSKVIGNGVTGAAFGNILALFADSRERADGTLSFRTEEPCTVYLTGLASGTWSVSADGNPLRSYSATEEGGMIVFCAPAGVISVTHIQD